MPYTMEAFSGVNADNEIIPAQAGSSIRIKKMILQSVSSTLLVRSNGATLMSLDTTGLPLHVNRPFGLPADQELSITHVDAGTIQVWWEYTGESVTGKG